MDSEWEQFLQIERNKENGIRSLPTPPPSTKPTLQEIKCINNDSIISCKAPPLKQLTNNLTITTETVILYLDQMIQIEPIFWSLPILEYWEPKDGIIKKEMKIVSHTIEEYQEYIKKRDEIKEHTFEHCIKNCIVTTNLIGGTKKLYNKKPYYYNIEPTEPEAPQEIVKNFKDVRKLMIGCSKKHLLFEKAKQKKSNGQLYCSYFAYSYFQIPFHIGIFRPQQDGYRFHTFHPRTL